MGVKTFLVIAFVFFFALSIHAGDVLYEANNGSFVNHTSVYDFTESELSWSNEAYLLNEESIVEDAEGLGYVRVRLLNLVNKFLDWFGYSVYEVGKLGVETGFNAKGEFSLMSLLLVIKWLFVAMILFYLFLPLAALFLVFKAIGEWLFVKIRKDKEEFDKRMK